LFKVEFLGLPGVGKTTIRKSLVRHLQAIDKKKYLSIEEAFIQISKSKIDKIYRVLLNSVPASIAIILYEKLMNRSIMQFDAQNAFLAKHGKALASYFASDEFNSMSIIDKTTVISAFMQAGALNEIINWSIDSESIIFFEEGLIQKSFMFVSKESDASKDSTKLQVYLENIPFPDILVYLKADPDICRERMLTRPAGVTDRLKKSDNEEIKIFLKNTEIHIDNVLNWLRSNHMIQLIEVSNNKDIDTLVRELGIEIIAHTQKSSL